MDRKTLNFNDRYDKYMFNEFYHTLRRLNYLNNPNYLGLDWCRGHDCWKAAANSIDPFMCPFCYEKYYG